MRRHLAAPLLLLAGGLSLAFQGIGVAPPREELRLSPGAYKTVEVKVFTTEEAALQVSSRIIDWTMKPDGTVVEVPRGSQPYSSRSWIQTSLDPFAIAKDRYRSIRVTVRVPDDPGLSGSYWAALQFVTTPPNPDPASTVVIRVAANYIVYVTIAGSERPGARILRFDRENDGFVLDVANTGNTYLRLRGELRFLDERGQVLRSLPIPERVVLREGIARMRLSGPWPAEAALAAVELASIKPVPLPYRLYAELPLK